VGAERFDRIPIRLALQLTLGHSLQLVKMAQKRRDQEDIHDDWIVRSIDLTSSPPRCDRYDLTGGHSAECRVQCRRHGVRNRFPRVIRQMCISLRRLCPRVSEKLAGQK
jgi:hypothetical protein